MAVGEVGGTEEAGGAVNGTFENGRKKLDDGRLHGHRSIFKFHVRRSVLKRTNLALALRIAVMAV